MHIFKELENERFRQIKKFGEQNIPCLDPVLLNRENSCTPERMCEEYGILSPQSAQTRCDSAFKSGNGTYAHILIEEVAEAIGEFDPVKRRAELIQVAAVAIGWIQKIDRLAEAETLDITNRDYWLKRVHVIAIKNEMIQSDDEVSPTMNDIEHLFKLENMMGYFLDNMSPAEALTKEIIRLKNPVGHGGKQ